MDYSIKILKEQLNKAQANFNWYNSKSCKLSDEIKYSYSYEYQSIIDNLIKSINKLEE